MALFDELEITLCTEGVKNEWAVLGMLCCAIVISGL